MGTTPKLLRYWRKRCGLSQSQLAEKTGLSQSVISKYENEQAISGIPSETLETIVKALGLTMGGFFEHEHERNAERGVLGHDPGSDRKTIG